MQEVTIRPHRPDGREPVDPVSPEGDLIRRAQLGDHGAFTDLLRTCDDRMRGLAHRLMGSRASMDDALQDAYLKAYRKLGTYDGRAAFSTWLYSVVYRTCLDHLRRRSRQAEVSLEAVADVSPDGPGHDERAATRDALRWALAQLPPDQAAAITLVDGEGLSYDEAAVVLDTKPGTVASRLNRARSTLRTLLTDDDQPGSDAGGAR